MNDDAPPETPRWVKVSAIAAIVLVVLFLAVHLAGGGFRGHGPSHGGGDHPPPARSP